MELLLIFFAVILVAYYILRPTSKREENDFKSKNNWRGGF
jgi:preprotein translocase subunit YajC